jgi:Heterokaryon incompatibility protein (HET)
MATVPALGMEGDEEPDAEANRGEETAEVKKSLGTRAFEDMMWFFIHFNPEDGYSARAIRGIMFALWSTTSLMIRLMIHTIYLWFLDILYIPSRIHLRLLKRSKIQFDNLTEYLYEPLSGFSEIRVLMLHPGNWNDDISCDLQIVSLAKPITYEAISYSWGEDKERHKIRCGQGFMEIRHNLFSALRQFRHVSKSRIFWADALCTLDTFVLLYLRTTKSSQVSTRVILKNEVTKCNIWDEFLRTLLVP